MRFKFGLSLLLVLVAHSGLAQADGEIAAFNDAWRAYTAAVETGDKHEEVETARAVLDAGRALFSETDERVPVLIQNYGSALLASGRKDEAGEQLEIALEMLEEAHGKDSIELVPTLTWLGDARGGVGNEQRQMRVYKRALRISAEHHGESSPEYGALAFEVGKNVFEQSRSQDGKKYIEIAHDVFLSEYGETDARVGLTNFYLGKMGFSRKLYKTAGRYLEAALPAFQGDSDDIKSLRLVTRALLVQAYENRGETDLATPHCIAIGSESQISENQEYKPIFRLAPQYPSDMLSRGQEGFVDFSFTIDENGFVKDPVVIQSEPGGSFESAAEKVVKRFRYAPRFIDGTAVAAEGVKTRISFQLVD